MIHDCYCHTMETRIYSRCWPTCLTSVVTGWVNRNQLSTFSWMQVCVQCRGRILQRTQNGLCQVLRWKQMSTGYCGFRSQDVLPWSRQNSAYTPLRNISKPVERCQEKSTGLFVTCDLWRPNGPISESGLIMRTDWEVIRQAANDRTLRVRAWAHHDLQMDVPLKNHMMVMS